LRHKNSRSAEIGCSGFPSRAEPQTRAEDVSAMSNIQTRRRFLAALSVAGIAGFLHAPPALAGEGLSKRRASG